MKHLITIVFCLFCFNLLLTAQPSNVNSLFNKYGGEEGFTAMTLNDAAPLFKSMGNDAVAQEVLKTVKQLRILSFDPKKGKNSTKGKQFSSEIRSLKIQNYEELLSLQEGGSSIRMFTKIETKGDNQFLMLVSDNSGESLILYLTGTFNKKQIGDLGKALRKGR